MPRGEQPLAQRITHLLFEVSWCTIFVYQSGEESRFCCHKNTSLSVNLSEVCIARVRLILQPKPRSGCHVSGCWRTADDKSKYSPPVGSPPPAGIFFFWWDCASISPPLHPPILAHFARSKLPTVQPDGQPFCGYDRIRRGKGMASLRSCHPVCPSVRMSVPGTAHATSTKPLWGRYAPLRALVQVA